MMGSFSASGMFNTLSRGIGLAVCPETLVAESIESRRLVRIPWSAAPEETTLFMIRHADKWCSPATARFIQITEAVVARTRR